MNDHRPSRWLRATSATLLMLLLALIGCDGSERAKANAPAAPAGVSKSAGSRSAVDPSTAADSEPRAAQAAVADVSALYADVLAACVTEDGLVRYDVLAEDVHRAKLDATITAFASQPLPSESPSVARLAFLCNAYNANALRLALIESRKDGFGGVRESRGFFDAMPITVASEAMTLDDLSQRIRGLHDPRVHAALVFGAMSCPPLRAEPYAADRLEAQLNDQCRRWLDDQSKNRAARTNIVLSEIFQRHAGDFDVAPYDGVVGFVRKHSRPNGNLRDFVRNVTNLKIEYAPFDWTLNDAGE